MLKMFPESHRNVTESQHREVPREGTPGCAPRAGNTGSNNTGSNNTGSMYHGAVQHGSINTGSIPRQ